MPAKRRTESIPARPGLTYCRQFVGEQIAAVERGEFNLRIPRSAKLMQKVPGLHFHPMAELNFQISAATTLHLPRKQVRMLPGTTSILRKGLPHRAESRRYKGQPFLFFVVEHLPSYLGVILSRGEPGDWPIVIFHRYFPPSENKRLAGYLDDMTAAQDRGSPTDRKTARGLLLAYWAGLSDVLATRPPKPKREHPQISRCRQLVMGNLSDPNLSVRLLARWVKLAPDYLSHLFCGKTGIPLKSYINERRIALARDLLGDRSLNISEIAWASGYSDPGYFARVFKRATGLSPRGFRRGVFAPTGIRRDD